MSVTFQNEYGTLEYEREVALHNGWPYGAELTYKHPYWSQDDYHAAWDAWCKSGGQGLEPQARRY